VALDRYMTAEGASEYGFLELFERPETSRVPARGRAVPGDEDEPPELKLFPDGGQRVSETNRPGDAR
jgi:hypothetical protein